MRGLDGSIGGLMGLRLISNPNLVIDTGNRSWARVRSHGRARRRLKRGFRQNIDVIWAPDPTLYRVGDKIIAHPAKLAELSRAVSQQAGGYGGEAEVNKNQPNREG